MKRQHNTGKPQLNLRRRYVQPPMHFKPVGLWYGIDGEWLDWCSTEMPDWVRGHLFELELDMERMLVISNHKDLEMFVEAYGIKVGEHHITIDWNRLAKERAGIEIQNYHDMKWSGIMERGKNVVMHSFFLAWDVSSGCVWDLSAVKEHKKVTFNKKQYETSAEI